MSRQSDDAYPRADTFGDWYTVDAVLHALDGAAGAQCGRQFVSYLWFDAWTANTDRLTTHDRGRSVAAWVGRSKTSPFYKNGRRLSLVEAAQEASKLSGVRAERFRSAIAGQLDVAKGIVGEVPGAVMSDEAKRFAIEVIKANAARVMPLMECMGSVEVGRRRRLFVAVQLTDSSIRSSRTGS